MTAFTLQGMNWVDFVFIALIFISTIISVVRGFVREAISLATWVFAFWLGVNYASEIAIFFEGHITNPTVRLIIGFAIVFIIVLLAGGLVNHLISALINKTGLSSTDRALGIFFGLARGILLLGIIILMVQMTSAEDSQAWNQSELVPHLQGLADWLEGLLPDKFADATNQVMERTFSSSERY